MNKALLPTTIRPPFGKYSHGMEVPAGSRLLYTAGQLGADSDGTVPATVEAQAELCFQAIGAILQAGGMDYSDIVRVTAFVTKREDMAAYMSVRDRYVSDPLPVSTLYIVTGFSRPEFLVEVEAIAAKAG